MSHGPLLPDNMHMQGGTPAGKSHRLLCMCLQFAQQLDADFSMLLMTVGHAAGKYRGRVGVRCWSVAHKLARLRAADAPEQVIASARAAALAPLAAGRLVSLYQELKRRYPGHPGLDQQLPLCRRCQRVPVRWDSGPGGAVRAPAGRVGVSRLMHTSGRAGIAFRAGDVATWRCPSRQCFAAALTM